MSVRAIGRKTGLSYGLIHRLLGEVGVQLRDWGRQHEEEEDTCVKALLPAVCSFNVIEIPEELSDHHIRRLRRCRYTLGDILPQVAA